MMIEAHGLGVDRDGVPVAGEVREIAAMQANRHDFAPKSCISRFPRRAAARASAEQTIENKRLSPCLGRAV
jgi:predicted alpha/beta-hydrolase family hydrolase